MSYKTYTTEALVCGSRHSNTSDKSYLLFSPDAGMVWASAKSVREERSKQRYALQDFSHIRVSLVKGKSGWRIGSVESFGNAFMAAKTRIQRGCINHLFALLRRYVHGEVSLPNVYEDLAVILNDQAYLEMHCVRIQQLFAVRLLSELGYVAPSAVVSPLIALPSIIEAVEAYDPSMEKEITKVIEEAGAVSHL